MAEKNFDVKAERHATCPIAGHKPTTSAATLLPLRSPPTTASGTNLPIQDTTNKIPSIIQV